MSDKKTKKITILVIIIVINVVVLILAGISVFKSIKGVFENGGQASVEMSMEDTGVLEGELEDESNLGEIINQIENGEINLDKDDNEGSNLVENDNNESDLDENDNKVKSEKKNEIIKFLTVENILSIVIIIIALFLMFLAIAILIKIK